MVDPRRGLHQPPAPAQTDYHRQRSQPPFGLPREAVGDLGWPKQWPQLVAYCRRQGRDEFRAALDRYRESRPTGKRYAHRAADHPAGSHSPLKLVNPPVGLMFLEGAPRLLDAGVNIPGLHPGDSQRVALEAYPGFSARQMVTGSYKNDAAAKQTPARRQARKSMVALLTTGDNPFGLTLAGSTQLLDSLVGDASGDRLDAVLCAMQAAWAWQRRDTTMDCPCASIRWKDGLRRCRNDKKAVHRRPF